MRVKCFEKLPPLKWSQISEVFQVKFFASSLAVVLNSLLLSFFHQRISSLSPQWIGKYDIQLHIFTLHLQRVSVNSNARVSQKQTTRTVERVIRCNSSTFL